MQKERQHQAGALFRRGELSHVGVFARRIDAAEFQSTFRRCFGAVGVEGDGHFLGTFQLVELFLRKS